MYDIYMNLVYLMMCIAFFLHQVVDILHGSSLNANWYLNV